MDHYHMIIFGSFIVTVIAIVISPVKRK
ncbi:putative holin-like toxin [Heyndrickxia sporothermodurans]